jgi:two-component system, OmpR family, sensor histidine kinase KdpD
MPRGASISARHVAVVTAEILLAVALASVLVAALDSVAAIAGLGVVYLLAVLTIAVRRGRVAALAAAVLSVLAFNYFFLPPIHRLTITDSENFAALSVFLVAAVVTGSIADLARARAAEADQRRREADLAADLARILLSGPSVEEALAPAGERIAAALDLPWAVVREDGTVQVPDEADRAAVERVTPAVQTLVAAARERDHARAEAVETQALRRSDELKTALLRTVSHDLRSPLTAIMTAADAMSADGLSAEEREELTGAITAEARRLSSLVEKLLDLSRLQAGVGEPRRDWCSVEEILHAAVDDLGVAPERFRFAIDPDLPLVRADAAQLERAFANILENAARYSAGEAVSVRARAVGARVMVRIVDRGPGIPAAEIARIFEPFHRPAADRSAHTGSGLGLAIARGFVEANGGNVWAESLPGQGATFVVALPLEVAAAVAP